MRPKVVIIVLVAAFALLGAVAVFKGTAVKHEAPSDTASAATNSTTASSSGNTGSSTVVNPADVEQARVAVVQKELEQIQQLQNNSDGSNNPIIIAALLDKARNNEPEVRKAAVESLREMNDTNAIPGLEQVATGIQDAREKVAVLDAIDYLKLPNAIPDDAVGSTNDFVSSKIPPEHMNQAFQKDTGTGPKKKSKKQAERNAAPGNGQGQPQ